MTESFDITHARFMARALQLARRGCYTTKPNPRVGCVLVKNGGIVGEGWHKRAGEAHAEIEALRAAGTDVLGATAYVTLEPCCHYGRTAPCSDALIRAGVSRVVAAMTDPNPKVAGNGLKALADAGIETVCGVLRSEAEKLNQGFCMRMRSGRPLVFSKVAMSLDGRTAMASGESQWITSECARQDVHRLRAGCSAIVTGVDSVIADDPSLTARLDGAVGGIVQPLRVIVDSMLRTPAGSRMTRLPGTSLIATTSADRQRRQRLEQAGFEVVWLPAAESGRVDLPSLLDHLATREVNDVMVETGAVLNGALLQAGLVDELVVYMAPSLLGDDGRGAFHLPGLTKLSERIELRLLDVRQVGADLRLRCRIGQSFTVAG
jgi:diaminohydroxyphosphoribosylaminopyrimidine deaminase / 5-amino-6-(5-phosphoribosylamino)uracil reductase